MAGGTRSAFAVGDWLVEPELNRISTTGGSLCLRKQLMEVLVYLARLDGGVATLESLHDDLWRGKVVSSGTIYNCIADLRQALASDGKQVEYIETIPKTGYRLAPPVVTRPDPAGASEAPASVAVLPLANRSGDPDIEYLCDGIVDEVLYRLKQVDGLRVYSAASLKDQSLEPRVAGLRFGARTVLSGSLQRSKQRLRLSFRLEDVASGESIWAERYDHEIADVLDVQDAVARQVAQALRPALGIGAPQAAVPPAGPRSFEALDAFLLGQHALSSMTEADFDRGIGYLEQAVALDPGFARAHYRLYLACHLRRRYFGDDDKTLEKARRAAANAQRHGFHPPVPWIHIKRRLYRENLPGLRELALEAIDKIAQPDREWGSFGYEQLTWVLAATGLFVATRDFAKHMLDSPFHNFEDSDADEELPHYYGALGEFDEAIRLWSAEVQKDPVRPLFHYERSVLYARTGQFAYAERDIELLHDEAFHCMAMAFYCFWRQQPERVEEFRRRLARRPDLHPTYLVYSNLLAGDVDAAAGYYLSSVDPSSARSFIDLGSMRAMFRAKLPGELVARLEAHPRFTALLADRGITDAWRRELIERLNAISDVTGIMVAPDPD